jgi:hypothetical protein
MEYLEGYKDALEDFKKSLENQKNQINKTLVLSIIDNLLDKINSRIIY